MSHRPNNIVLGGVGVCVWCKDEGVEKTMVFHHLFVSAPMTFGNYCMPLEKRDLCFISLNLFLRYGAT